MRRTSAILLALTLTAAAVGCDQPEGDEAVEAPAAEAEPAEPAAEAAAEDQAADEPAADDAAGAGQAVSRLATATDAKLGTYLTDGDGRAVYLFESDKGADASTCYDACAEMWPPVLAEGKPELGDKLDASLVGTLERKGGATQVTYAGWPLYYYKPDQGAGQTKGQDIEGFGAEWYLLTPNGEKVHAEGEEEGHDG